MSTKSTIILSNDNEHWYTETFSLTDGLFDIVLEIDKKNIKEFEDDAEYICITLKGSSDLVKQINELLTENSSLRSRINRLAVENGKLISEINNG